MILKSIFSLYRLSFSLKKPNKKFVKGLIIDIFVLIKVINTFFKFFLITFELMKRLSKFGIHLERNLTRIQTEIAFQKHSVLEQGVVG